VDHRHGKDAETGFRALKTLKGRTLIEAQPLTGRTHQIRVHLAESGHPVFGDDLYGGKLKRKGEHLALRAVELAYHDPFTRRTVKIVAETGWFLREYGFNDTA